MSRKIRQIRLLLSSLLLLSLIQSLITTRWTRQLELELEELELEELELDLILDELEEIHLEGPLLLIETLVSDVEMNNEDGDAWRGGSGSGFIARSVEREPLDQTDFGDGGDAS